MTTTTKKDRIVFASCNSQHYYRTDDGDSDTTSQEGGGGEKSIWDSVLERTPAAFVWAGDAVYADDFAPGSSLWRALPVAGTPRKLRDLYRNLIDNDKGYRKLVERASPSVDNSDDSEKKTPLAVLGALDDHDYGCNNGDSTYEHKLESARLYVDFLKRSQGLVAPTATTGDGNDDETAKAASATTTTAADFSIMERRALAGKGVYGAKVFDFSSSSQRRRRRRIQQQRRDDDNEQQEDDDDVSPDALLSDEEGGIEDVPESDGGGDGGGGGASQQRRIPYQLSNRSVAVFLLDIRTHKSPWRSTFPSKYRLNYEGDFLGTEQWRWLERSLRRSKATVNVIVQGLQVHADRFWDGNKVEDWSRFPSAQHRLYQALLKSNVSAPILISGDVHMAELLRKDCRQPKHFYDNTVNGGDGGNPTTRMLLEVTSSGMTHSWGTNICARPYSGAACQSRHVARALTAGMHFAHNNGAWTDVVDLRTPAGSAPTDKNATPRIIGDDPRTKKGIQYVLQRNFGELEFDWDNRQVVVRVFGQTRDGVAVPFISTGWDFDVLSGLKPVKQTGKIKGSDYERLYQRMLGAEGIRRHVNEDDWICVNYRGYPSFARKMFGFISPITLAGFLMFGPPVLATVALAVLARRLVFRRRNAAASKVKQS